MQEVTALKGIGPGLAQKFALLGIKSVADLALFFPRRYEDYSDIMPIVDVHPGMVTIEAEITQIKGRYVRRGMHITEATARDGTEQVRLVWFNQPYRAQAIKPGATYFISGKYELSRQRFAIMNPSCELASEFPVNTARIVPVYRETKGLTSKQIRKAVREALPWIRSHPETLPHWLLAEHSFMRWSHAVEALHFPSDGRQLDEAKRRLAFEEVFELSLASLLNKYELLKDTSTEIPFSKTVAKKFVDSLPFKLTDDQRAAAWQVYTDIQKKQPMNRLVEGDVGSGKTVIAAMAAMMAMEAGFQVALMAPTELLARQHAETFYALLTPLNKQDQVALLVGGMTRSQKEQAHKTIKHGLVRCIIGTHALVQESVDMHSLALVIIDEQHRFGVEQRKTLMAKAGHMPHVLSLTATPIPRSLALTLYGEMDISIVGSRPEGRLPIVTQICSPNSRAQLYDTVDKELAAGRQMFVVCPLIAEGASGAISAAKMHQTLSKQIFKHRRVGLLHGKMKPQEKNDIMLQFAGGKLDVLVSTTVIEVGVDIPNATVMIIEGADMFGLAQLHQLRGRVGRGVHQGYCFLVTRDSKAPPKRLTALAASNNGFELAELDLELRGPGAIYGTLQHGALDLKVAELTDTKLIAFARGAALKFINQGDNLLQYDRLHERVQSLRAVTNLN